MSFDNLCFQVQIQFCRPLRGAYNWIVLSPTLLGHLDTLVPSALKANKFSGPPALWSPQTCFGPPHMCAVCGDFEDWVRLQVSIKIIVQLRPTWSQQYVCLLCFTDLVIVIVPVSNDRELSFCTDWIHITPSKWFQFSAFLWYWALLSWMSASLKSSQIPLAWDVSCRKGKEWSYSGTYSSKIMA